MKIRTPKLREFRLVAGFLAAAAILGALGACDDPADRAEKYIERGKNFYEAGDYTRARLEFRNALQIDPNRVEPLYYLGAIYDANGDLKNAYNRFVLVVDKDPKHIRALIKLGHYLLLGNQPDGAMEKATAVLELENDNAEANALRSAIFLRRGELTLAEQASKAAIDVAINLGKYYGRALDRPVVYTQGVALSGRLRLDALVNNSPGKTTNEITALVEPYVAVEPEEIGAGVFTSSDGTANYAGLCWADELAIATDAHRSVHRHRVVGVLILVEAREHFVERNRRVAE